MLKNALGFCCALAIVLTALWSAQQKMNDLDQVKQINVGAPVSSLNHLGEPVSVSSSERMYFLNNGSTLVVSVFQHTITGAWLNLKNPISIQDEHLKSLRFVQVGVDESLRPTWFYAGLPGDGRVFKVVQNGLIHSITWVRPFGQKESPRQLQALYKEFTSHQPVRL